MFQRARRQLILPFLLPQTILYLLFMFVPLVLTVFYGFTNWEGHGAQWQLAGLANFNVIIQDQEFILNRIEQLRH